VRLYFLEDTLGGREDALGAGGSGIVFIGFGTIGLLFEDTFVCVWFVSGKGLGVETGLSL